MKLCTLIDLAPFPLTLDDLEGHSDNATSYPMFRYM